MTDPSTWPIAISRQLRIGHTIIDTEALRARRGALDETIEPKVLGVLLVLADQAGEVVSRADLIDQVWGTVAGGDESLTRAISRIRKLLGDERGVQAAIETVPRRGYRLLAEVIWLEEPPQGADKQTPDTLEPAHARTTESRPQHASSRPPPRAVLVVAALGAIAFFAAVFWFSFRTATEAEGPEFAAGKSVAILPFEDLSPAGDHQWFADGFTSELINLLVRVGDLKVASSSATFNLPPTVRSPREIADHLDVTHLVEGSVRQVGDRYRLTVRLVRISDAATVWSTNEDVAGSDIIAIQEDTAAAIARALRTLLSDEELSQMVNLGTNNVEAYLTYLEGRQANIRGNSRGESADFEAAVSFYTRATELDPTFAVAQNLAAEAWWQALVIGALRDGSNVTEFDNEALLRKVRMHRRAAEIHAQNPTLQRRVRAINAFTSFDFDTAYSVFLELKTDGAEFDNLYFPLTAAVVGKPEEAEAYLRARYDPAYNDPDVHNAVVWAYIVGAPDLSLMAYQRLNEIVPDLEYQILSNIHRLQLTLGETESARRTLDQIQSEDIAPLTQQRARLSQLCAERRIGEARAVGDELLELLGSNPRMGYVWEVFMILGEEDRAYAELEKTDAEGRFEPFLLMFRHPYFDPSRLPNFSGFLEDRGVRPRPATPLPFACPSPD